MGTLQEIGFMAMPQQFTARIIQVSILKNLWTWLMRPSIPYGHLEDETDVSAMGRPDWKVVQEFIDVGYSRRNPAGFGDMTDGQLRRKIQLLGVPWRSASGY